MRSASEGSLGDDHSEMFTRRRSQVDAHLVTNHMGTLNLKGSLEACTRSELDLAPVRFGDLESCTAFTFFCFSLRNTPFFNRDPISLGFVACWSRSGVFNWSAPRSMIELYNSLAHLLEGEPWRRTLMENAKEASALMRSSEEIGSFWILKQFKKLFWILLLRLYS